MTRNKYNAQPTIVDGIRFDSGKEARRYGELKNLERAGIIRNLELQPVFPLIISGKPVVSRSARYPNGRKAKYTADFGYFEGNKRIVEDVKSRATMTEAAALRIAVVEAIYNVEIRLT